MGQTSTEKLGTWDRHFFHLWIWERIWETLIKFLMVTTFTCKPIKRDKLLTCLAIEALDEMHANGVWQNNWSLQKEYLKSTANACSTSTFL